MPAPEIELRARATRHLGLLLPILLIGAVLVLIAPLSPFLLDLLLTANLTLAVMILLRAIQVPSPREFSVFPTLLLTTTLARLVLNVASTRLILSEGAQLGTSAAGGVIASFGDFVASGSPLVGLVIFAILVAIQFLVITKGATRISEVAARFSLDALPGRQATIDAELKNELISPLQARELRQELTRQADFYGAMDGASKFIRGDALAGLIITGINLVGGLAMGIFSHGMDLNEAVRTYSVLTIGDGLVSQLPAFVISLAAGLIVTRSSQASNLSQDVIRQIVSDPQPLFLASGLLIVLAMCGFPAVPTIALAGASAVLGVLLTKSSETGNDSGSVESPTRAENTSTTPQPAPERNLKKHFQVEPLELELGVSLIRLADVEAGGDLLERVSALRHRIAADLGFILPKVRIQDNLHLDPRRFQIKLRGVPVASGNCYARAMLAVDDGFVAGPIRGVSDVEPATQNRAVWVEQDEIEQAKELGYRLVSPHVVILQVLERVVRRHASELLTRQTVHQLLEHLQNEALNVIEDIQSSGLAVSQIHQILVCLLEEQIPIRDLEAILSTVEDKFRQTSDPVELVSAARLALRRTIVDRSADEQGKLHAVVLSDEAERSLLDGFEQSRHNMRQGTNKRTADRLWSQVHEALDRIHQSGRPAVLLCRAASRWILSQAMRESDVEAKVISFSELPPQTDYVVHAEIILSSPGAELADDHKGYTPGGESPAFAEQSVTASLN